MSTLNVDGTYEVIPSACQSKDRHDFSEYIEDDYKYTTYILADTDVDSFEEPLDPSIPSGDSTTWAFMWHYIDEPERKGEYKDYPDYGWTWNNMEVSLEYGDDRFETDIDVENPYPSGSSEYDEFALSVGAGYGPISVGVSKSVTPDGVSVDSEDYQYTEWEIPFNSFPTSQEDAAGVAFDIKGGNSYITSPLTAEWSRGFGVIEYVPQAREPYDVIYSREEGDSMDIEVDIKPS
ncbi:hypothetical protein [Natrinema gari]|uniref:hypothetical protein n=1 Tax=Natrinema gari TaxID=419186 RepID=UPI001267B1EE|nr:hypothetical protein [Natrinema gari]